ncbi:MAG: F0F1 ATP synthase subunit gamma [Novosphingobium sp.]|nr:F0F1 ATP synthase subunit gamma [Novosphingobium sp.]
MAEQLGMVEGRLRGIGQFSSVVSAIRGMAAVRLNEAEEHLKGIAAYAGTVADAIGQALALLSQMPVAAPEGTTHGMHLVIALCSEQGFVGGFNGRVLDCLGATGSPTVLFVVGRRGASEARERGLEVSGEFPMAGHAQETVTLANRLAEELYRRIEKEGIDRVTLVHAVPTKQGREPAARPLIPFDFQRFPASTAGGPPLLNLSPDALLEALAREYVFAEISEALMLSYAAENEARMYAMLAARSNIDRKQGELTALVRRLRQEDITTEVAELAVGALVNMGGDRGS